MLSLERTDQDRIRFIFWEEILYKAIVQERRFSWKNYAISALYIIFSEAEIEKIVSAIRVKSSVLATLLLPIKSSINPQKALHQKKAQKKTIKGKGKNNSIHDIPEVENPMKESIDDFDKGVTIYDDETFQKTVAPKAKETDQNTGEEKGVRPKTPFNIDGNKESKDSIWYINNAGLVLLHPFFVHLFSKLQLIEKNKFKSSKEQQKAIQLVSYLHSGISEFPEYDLVLPKLICNYPFFW